jgi:hypothetical protein
VAEAAARASETDLQRASGDPNFQSVAQLLVKLPLLARAPGFEDAMADLGIQRNALESAAGYRVDLMTGRRERVQDKEAALSYARKALGYEMMTGADLMTHYPMILNAVDYTGEPPDAALKRISALLQCQAS